MATHAAYMEGTKKLTAGRVLWSWITTVDHKRIGQLYGVSAFFFFLVGGLEAVIMRLQLAHPDSTLVSAARFNELFTMHGTTMVFLAIMPMSAAFFNYMIPLLIGARDVAFPRLNALSYWVFFSGALLLHLSFLVGAVPTAGWFGDANLTSIQFSPTHSIDFWMLGLQVLGISSLMAGFKFIVTIINMRAPGMTLMRMPLFVWMSFVVQFLVVLAFPAITVALILLMFDRFFGTLFYAPAGGADPLLWQHLFWIFGHAEVYILILPAMGIVSEVLPTFSRKPLFGAPVVIYSGIMLGFLHLDHADRGADGREDPELDRHALGRQDLLLERALLLARLHRHVHPGRPLGRHALLPDGGPAADRLLLRRRPLPLRALRGLDLRALLGRLLLVAEDLRQAARRAAGQGALLADADRLQRHLFPDALPGTHRHAPADLHVRARPRLELLE